MIKLDYKLAPAKQNDDIGAATEEQLHYELFNGDIIFRMNGADFSTDWGWVPVLDFAVTMARLAKALPKDLSSLFEFTESESAIELKLEDGRVFVSCSYTKDSGIIDYSEFLDACLYHVAKVLTELSEQYTSLKKNSSFTNYLKEFKVPIL